MKKYLIILASLLGLTSCHVAEPEQPQPANSSLYARPGQQPPFNDANPYDRVGGVHNEVLYSYYDQLSLPQSLDSISIRVNSKAAQHPYFSGLPFSEYELIPVSRMEYIASGGRNALEEIISGLPLSDYAKEDFRHFLSAVLEQVEQEEEYAVLYDFVVQYEAHLTTSTVHSAKEKEYLLTVTSITRHSMYAKRKRPKKNTDPDWDWLTANIAAATDASQWGSSQAILAALKAGIRENR